MTVKELMSRDVVAVTPDTTLKDVARLFVNHRISGVPVLAEHGAVLGVVTEADILRKERGLRPTRGGPLAWLVDGSDRTEVRKAVARTAGEAMTSPAITTEPWRTVAEVARVMIDRAVNRLPVVQHGRLVGIVSRGDLVRAFKRPDAEIAREIADEAIGESLHSSSDDVDVEVRAGEVIIRGRVPAHSDAQALVRLVSEVPGVVGVRSELLWRLDDLTLNVPSA